MSTHAARSYLPSVAPSCRILATTLATSGSANQRGPEGAASRSLSPATNAAPRVVQRSATAATGTEPANRHLTKYPTPSGCQCGSQYFRTATSWTLPLAARLFCRGPERAREIIDDQLNFGVRAFCAAGDHTVALALPQ